MDRRLGKTSGKNPGNVAATPAGVQGRVSGPAGDGP